MSCSADHDDIDDREDAALERHLDEVLSLEKEKRAGVHDADFLSPAWCERRGLVLVQTECPDGVTLRSTRHPSEAWRDLRTGVLRVDRIAYWPTAAGTPPEGYRAQ